MEVVVKIEMGDLRVFCSKVFPNTDAAFNPEGINIKRMMETAERKLRKLRREAVLGITEASGVGV